MLTYLLHCRLAKKDMWLTGLVIGQNGAVVDLETTMKPSIQFFGKQRRVQRFNGCRQMLLRGIRQGEKYTPLEVYPP